MRAVCCAQRSDPFGYMRRGIGDTDINGMRNKPEMTNGVCKFRRVGALLGLMDMAFVA